MSNRRFDVIVIGGGTGGLFLAWLLGQKGLSALLVDRGSGPRPIPRGEILQPNGLAILDRHGLLESLKGSAYRVERFEFSTTRRLPLCTVEYRLLPSPYAYGLIALPHLLQEALLSRLASSSGVRLIWSAAFCGLEREGSGWKVRVREGEEERSFSSTVVVGADGARSAVRQALGIAARIHDYRDGYLTLVCPRPAGFDSEGRYYLGRREILGAFPVSDDALYLFYMIDRGDLDRVHRRGIDAFKKSISGIDPSTAGPLESISSFDRIGFMPCVRVWAGRWVCDHAMR
jgi:2-polyprenyl-6-methoxyphenol hydroxylase-like FAD-dependent oxidoreductase